MNGISIRLAVGMYVLRNLAEVVGVMVHVCYLRWKPCLMIIIGVQAIKDSIMHASDDIISVILFYHLSYQQRTYSLARL